MTGAPHPPQSPTSQGAQPGPQAHPSHINLLQLMTAAPTVTWLTAAVRLMAPAGTSPEHVLFNPLLPISSPSYHNKAKPQGRVSRGLRPYRSLPVPSQHRGRLASLSQPADPFALPFFPVSPFLYPPKSDPEILKYSSSRYQEKDLKLESILKSRILMKGRNIGMIIKRMVQPGKERLQGCWREALKKEDLS